MFKQTIGFVDHGHRHTKGTTSFSSSSPSNQNNRQHGWENEGKKSRLCFQALVSYHFHPFQHHILARLRYSI